MRTHTLAPQAIQQISIWILGYSESSSSPESRAKDKSFRVLFIARYKGDRVMVRGFGYRPREFAMDEILSSESGKQVCTLNITKSGKKSKAENSSYCPVIGFSFSGVCFLKAVFRFRVFSLYRKWRVCSVLQASLSAELSSLPPLNLTLRKTPSFLNLLKLKLSKNDNSASQRATEKLKASNFPVSLLQIGSWQVNPNFARL